MMSPEQREEVVLKDRELIYIESRPGFPVKCIGVALSNEEAQKYVELDWRVFGDADGPYLVLRLDRSKMSVRDIINHAQGDVTFWPVRWTRSNPYEKGVICYLKGIA